MQAQLGSKLQELKIRKEETDKRYEEERAQLRTVEERVVAIDST